MDAIQERRQRVREARKALGDGAKPLAAEYVAKVARQLADAAGAEINISQQSISDFENNDDRKRIPAWLTYVERALDQIATDRKASLAPISEELDELEGLMLAVLTTRDRDSSSPRAKAKRLAAVARDYFGRDPDAETIPRGGHPKPRAGGRAASRSQRRSIEPG